MAPPPSYGDLGKQAKDLFSKGYDIGFLKVQSKTQPHKQGEIKLNADHNTANGLMVGAVELKYKLPDYGVTLTEKWNTDNVITTEVVGEDHMSKGTKLTFVSDFSPVTKTRNCKVKSEFVNDAFHLNADVSVAAQPVMNASAVFNYQNFLFGVQGGYNVEKASVTATNFSIGRVYSNYVLNASVNDSTHFTGSLYQKVNDKMEIGANCGWKQGGDVAPVFGVASQYKVDPDWTVRGKLLHTGQIHLATSHRLNPHFKLTLSGMVEMKKFQEGGHKFGLGLEYEPCC